MALKLVRSGLFSVNRGIVSDIMEILSFKLPGYTEITDIIKSGNTRFWPFPLELKDGECNGYITDLHLSSHPDHPISVEELSRSFRLWKSKHSHDSGWCVSNSGSDNNISIWFLRTLAKMERGKCKGKRTKAFIAKRIEDINKGLHNNVLTVLDSGVLEEKGLVLQVKKEETANLIALVLKTLNPKGRPIISRWLSEISCQWPQIGVELARSGLTIHEYQQIIQENCHYCAHLDQEYRCCRFWSDKFGWHMLPSLSEAGSKWLCMGFNANQMTNIYAGYIREVFEESRNLATFLCEKVVFSNLPMDIINIVSDYLSEFKIDVEGMKRHVPVDMFTQYPKSYFISMAMAMAKRKLEDEDEDEDEDEESFPCYRKKQKK